MADVNLPRVDAVPVHEEVELHLVAAPEPEIEPVDLAGGFEADVIVPRSALSWLKSFRSLCTPLTSTKRPLVRTTPLKHASGRGW